MCYHKKEVNIMENENIPQTPEEETTETAVYTPRPLWQRVLAWIALALFLVVVAGYYVNIFRGGL